MKKPTLVSICGDPGGANAVAPVLKLLETEARLALTSYAYNEGVDVLRRQGIPNLPLPPEIDAAWTHRRLEEEHPSLVLTATSHNARNCEKLFISVARDLGIRSLAVLDYWSNYSLRFSDDRGALSTLPDTVAVMDPRARSEMTAEGIPADRILITGQPAFDALRRQREAFSAKRNLEIRASLGLSKADRLVLFASQPLKERNPALGLDEKAILGDLVHALEALPAEPGRNVTVLVRPHPRENRADYDSLPSWGIRVLISGDGDGRELAMAADLVVGMNSVFLVEACYLGCVVLSLQPGLRTKDTLPSNAWGASRGVVDGAGVAPAVRDLLRDEKERGELLSRCAGLQLEGKAARNIADRIYSMTRAAREGPTS